MNESTEYLSVDELHAKRAMAMAVNFLDKATCSKGKVSMEQRLRRISCFNKTLKALSRNENLNDSVVEQICVLSKLLKEQKRELAVPNDMTSPPSSSVKRSVDKIREDYPVYPSAHQHDDESIDKIQNLLFEQKEIQSKELSSERKSQEIILSELAGMTEILKQTTFKIHHSVQRQNLQLQEIQHFALENQEELEQQKKKMAERTKSMTRSVWASFATIIWLIGLFILTLAIMKFIPKPSANQTYSNEVNECPQNNMRNHRL